MKQLEPTSPVAVAPDLCRDLAGYSFRERLGECPLHETWRVQAPDGRIHLLQRLKCVDLEQMGLVAERLRNLAHPHLLPAQFCHTDSGQLLVGFEEGYSTLQDRHLECRSAGLPGIPQLELVGYLKILAETLDHLHAETGLMHLTLNPRNIFLRDGELYLGDFGLAQLCWLPTRRPLFSLNPRYAAPELWHGKLTRRVDQCSLALIYCEMLTGAHPAPHLGNLRTPERRWQLDLHLLSTTDQAIVAKALAVSAPNRFNNCTELARRLEEVAFQSHGLARPRFSALPSVLFTPRLLRSRENQPELLSPEQFLACLSEFTSNHSQQRQFADLRYHLKPGLALEHRCLVPLRLEEAMTCLQLNCRQWRLPCDRPSTQTFVLELGEGGIWRQLLGRRQGIKVELHFKFMALGQDSGVQDVVMEARPLGCTGTPAATLLERLGPPLLLQLRQALGALLEMRTAERLQWRQPLQVTPVGTNQELELPIHGLTKDISLGGVGFISRDPVPRREVYINLPWLPGCNELSVRANVVRGRLGENGWYELGASFRMGQVIQEQADS